MKLLVVGSIGLDTVETPYGKRERVVGGSANYFSISASLFTEVGMVGVIGRDYPESALKLLNQRGIDTRGIQKMEGETFHWIGWYGEDINSAHTLDTRLNVFESFSPELPEEYRKSPYIFLANIDPVLQMKVLEQVESPKLIACDTMNFWIEGKRTELLKVLERVDILFLNEGELKHLSGERNIISGLHWVRERGPQCIVLKRGEYGAMLFKQDELFWVPAFPTEFVRDPTGAGDSFAGGMLGYLCGRERFGKDDYRRALSIGTVVASFTVEQFSFERLLELQQEEFDLRFRSLHSLTQFHLDEIPKLRTFKE